MPVMKWLGRRYLKRLEMSQRPADILFLQMGDIGNALGALNNARRSKVLEEKQELLFEAHLKAAESIEDLPSDINIIRYAFIGAARAVIEEGRKCDIDNPTDDYMEAAAATKMAAEMLMLTLKHAITRYP